MHRWQAPGWRRLACKVRNHSVHHTGPRGNRHRKARRRDKCLERDDEGRPTRAQQAGCRNIHEPGDIGAGRRPDIALRLRALSRRKTEAKTGAQYLTSKRTRSFFAHVSARSCSANIPIRAGLAVNVRSADSSGKRPDWRLGKALQQPQAGATWLRSSIGRAASYSGSQTKPAPSGAGMWNSSCWPGQRGHATNQSPRQRRRRLRCRSPTRQR